MSAGFAGRHVVVVGDLSVDMFLEVPKKQIVNQILYLIDYIAYGFHLSYKVQIVKESCRKPISLHPGLATSLYFQNMLKIELYFQTILTNTHLVLPSAGPAPERGHLILK